MQKLQNQEAVQTESTGNVCMKATEMIQIKNMYDIEGIWLWILQIDNY